MESAALCQQKFRASTSDFRLPTSNRGIRLAHSHRESAQLRAHPREIPTMATTVNFKGNPVELSGTPPQIGDPAPAFSLTNTQMEPVQLSDSQGKIRILSVVPSIDTGVCATQTRHFNEALSKLPDNVEFYTISVDTPMAQGRWCGAEGISKMQMLSDFKGNTFGNSYGLYIPDMGLLARSVWIIDADDQIAYRQIVPEIGEEPNYDEVIEKANELAS